MRDHNISSVGVLMLKIAQRCEVRYCEAFPAGPLSGLITTRKERYRLPRRYPQLLYLGEGLRRCPRTVLGRGIGTTRGFGSDSAEKGCRRILTIWTHSSQKPLGWRRPRTMRNASKPWTLSSREIPSIRGSGCSRPRYTDSLAMRRWPGSVWIEGKSNLNSLSVLISGRKGISLLRMIAG